MNSDPASLENLNPIVLPADVGWLPLAPGWYVILVLAAVLLLWGAIRAVIKWRRNAYRREALREFQHLAEEEHLEALPTLLKRTALSSFPRSEVAALSGNQWHAFLDQAVGKPLFAGTNGQLLDLAAYQPERLKAEGLPTEPLWSAAGDWIKNHVAAGQ